MDEEVEKYIEKQQALQKEILKKVRNLILESLTDCEEKAAWGVATKQVVANSMHRKDYPYSLLFNLPIYSSEVSIYTTSLS